MFLGVVLTSVVECTIESWSGVDHHVDAVLLFNVLGHVECTDQRAFFHKLTTQYLSDKGVIVTCVQFHPMLKVLDLPVVDYDDLMKEMSTEGFRVALVKDFEVYKDLSNPSEEIVRMFQKVTGRSALEVRSAIEVTFAQPEARVVRNKLTIFAK